MRLSASALRLGATWLLLASYHVICVPAADNGAGGGGMPAAAAANPPPAKDAAAAEHASSSPPQSADQLVVASIDEAAARGGFVHAFVASLSMILVSELGDKTFFLAAIMAMKYSRTVVFAGAIAALGAMHVMSALFGYAAVLIPRAITYYASSALFFIFGLKMLREGWKMSPDEAKEELEETQAELKKYEDELNTPATQDPETGIMRGGGGSSLASMPARWYRRWGLRRCISPVFLEAATLNFLAEWGDRSQITAIVLAARENVAGVIVGGLAGHCFCTGLAVLGGRLVAQHLSIRTVTLIGGVVFLVFAVSVFFIPPG